MEWVDAQNNVLKVEGDLGEFEVVEESTDTEDDNNCEFEGNQIVPGKKFSDYPKDLMQASSQQAIGSVTVSNSENVHFGNNTYFNAPVTIKQVVQSLPGIDNPAYDTSQEHPDCKHAYHNTSEDLTLGNYVALHWIKLSLWAVGFLLLISTCVTVLVYSTNNDINGQDTLTFSEEYGNGNVSMVMDWLHSHILLVLAGVLVLQLTLLILIIQHSHTNNITEYSIVQDNKETSESSSSATKIAGELVVAPGHLRMVSRVDWLAQPVVAPLDPLRLPAPWVIITHTATASCFTQSKCVLAVRLMQTFHIESREWFDIGYNFLIGGDGSAYVGRGWTHMGAHTKGYNKYSIGIAFIGTFNTESPTRLQLHACLNLMKQGVADGHLSKDYKIFAHRQLMSTLSPGDRVYDIIKTWPHFVNTTEDTDFTKLLPNY